MKPRLLALSALLLALAAPGGWGLCAQPKAAAKKARAAKPQPARPQPETPTVGIDELLHPYAGENATRWGFDPEPQDRPFGQAQDDTGLSLSIGRESVVDPITQKELAPRPDAQKLRESLKNMKLKDALDQTGAKAGVQMDILKF